MKNIIGLTLVMASLTGCAVPGSVNSLPGLGIDASLCILHYRYQLVATHEECDDENWRVVAITDANSDAIKANRNALQGAIMGISNELCGEFLKRLGENPRNRSLAVRSTALFLSAAATGVAASESASAIADATSLTSAGTAFAGLGQLFGESYPEEIEDIVMGIDLARGEITNEIEDRRSLDLVRYPIPVAVNDALDYHKACSIAYGNAAIEQATNDAIDALDEEEGEEEGS